VINEKDIEHLLNQDQLLKALAPIKITALAKVLIKKYQVNWHHKLISDHLHALLNKDIKHLIICMPPRHGKTELASITFPAYCFGINPELKILAASYASGLAKANNRKIQLAIENPSYQEIFPDTKLNSKRVVSSSERDTSYLRNTETFEIVNHQGYYKCAGVGGGMTGLGADIFLIDDPIKGPQDADSKVMRDNLWDWYKSVADTRLEKNGQKIIIQTRWHEDDLVGRIKKYKEDGFEYLELEAIKELDKPYDKREMGEALWPSVYDLKFLENKKSNQRTWNSLYQQRPRPLDGTIIKEEQIKYYDYVNPEEMLITIQSWDLSFKGNEDSDFVCGGVLGLKGDDIYILDFYLGQTDFSGTINQFEIMSYKHPRAFTKLVEDAANGAALYSILKEKIQGIELWKPSGSKVARLNAVSPKFFEKRVYFPRNHPQVQQAVEQLLSFPRGENDDFVDMLSMGILSLSQANSMSIATNRNRVF
jgi:predicted phage terminase large subunit-like protein